MCLFKLYLWKRDLNNLGNVDAHSVCVCGVCVRAHTWRKKAHFSCAGVEFRSPLWNDRLAPSLPFPWSVYLWGRWWPPRTPSLPLSAWRDRPLHVPGGSVRQVALTHGVSLLSFADVRACASIVHVKNSRTRELCLVFFPVRTKRRVSQLDCPDPDATPPLVWREPGEFTRLPVPHIPAIQPARWWGLPARSAREDRRQAHG